ncbi:hypothetical protein G6N74_03620 [Mesorhizobium sp. CGMCC 1.15528]|uniref:Uncharacterized protein n=1 Tax=Mesorhizobium zhangyense TaxID=1776730 RepID=A0A7C9V556_9HYPH|nr:hypothetical protein [Mesorhizobium zhangyense]NGN40143.1 hypothetical protein [Mesorhizobium zhangyense]
MKSSSRKTSVERAIGPGMSNTAGLMAIGSAPLKLFFVPAWIPDTLRSFLAHEVENDELHLGLPPISTVGGLQTRK